MNQELLIETRGLSKWFSGKNELLRRKKAVVKALESVDLKIYRGETLGLVGESGSGKTTLGQTILQLHRPTEGRVFFKGNEITCLSNRELQPLRKKMQIVFQDPYGSLEQRMKIRDIVSEGLDIHKIGTRAERIDQVFTMLSVVGLSADHAERYPHEFSGGQRQRISLARALALNPEFLVADEPVSALDLSVQAQIINLLQDLTDKFNLTTLFISHDLSVVEHICDRVAVMYLGKIMEIATRKELYGNPQHPYTQALLEAVPKPDPQIRHSFKELKGDIPSPADPPSGCVFRTRCPLANKDCAELVPPLHEFQPGHQVACIKVSSKGN